MLLAAKWCWDCLNYLHGDRSRYVVSGDSPGGHLAMMVGMITPAAALGPTSPLDDEIAAIVDNFGPADIEAELGGVANADRRPRGRRYQNCMKKSQPSLAIQFTLEPGSIAMWV